MLFYRISVMAFHQLAYTVFVLISLERHHINGVTPPSFTHEPSDSIGKKVKGNLITLSCSAVGSMPITFTWIKTSLKREIQDISSDSRYTVHNDGRLVISYPDYNRDDGYYHCVAANSAGTRISKGAKLRIPYFIDKSGSLPINEAPTQGNPWRSNYPATESFPEPVYTWTKDSGPALQDDDRISFSKGGQLFIANVQTKDVGTYKSSVSNTATGGSYNRNPYSLSVRTSQGNVDAVISLRPVDQFAIQGKTTEVAFECFASGRPMPVISWKKNGNTISSSSKISFTDYNKRLKLLNPMKSDEGTYSCHITNQPSPSAAKAEAQLVVEIIPSFTAKPANEVETFVTRTARFPCNTAGSPAAKTVWYHNGRTVASSTSELTLTNLQPSDSGFYQCFATNDAGQSIATTYLKLNYISLYINTPPKDTVAIVGDTVELKCETSGTPTPIVMWRVTNKDGTKDVDVTSSSSRFRKKSTGALQVTNGMREDSGTYTCVSRNAWGSKNASAELKIINAEPHKPTPQESTKYMETNIGIIAALASFVAVLIEILICVLIYIWWKLRINARGRNQYESSSQVTQSSAIVAQNQLIIENSVNSDLPLEKQYMELLPIRSNEKPLEPLNNPMSTPEYAPLSPATRSWEVSQDKIVVNKVIGRGAFGQVAEGTATGLPWQNGQITVALKMLKEHATSADKKDLLSELNLLKQLKPHRHVIRLLGCVTEKEPLMVIIEYVPYGDLLGYLRKSRGINDTYYKDPDIKPKTNLTSKKLIGFAWQIADGMSYLDSKKIVHRDLAARNVLVGEKEQCKITDFGLARDIHEEGFYEKKTKGRLPVKWMALESLMHQNYSTQSDVWSYGVVLYELFTIGGCPYPKIPGREITRMLEQGYRMPKPPHVDDRLYQLMIDCWQEDLQARPSFKTLRNKMKTFEENHQTYVNLKDYNKKLYDSVDDLAV